MTPSPDLRARRIAAIALLIAAALPRHGHADPSAGWQGVTVSSSRGRGILPVLVSGDWARPEPDITRVVITLHGERRDASRYDAIAHDALVRSGASGRGTLLVTPRFPGRNDSTPAHLRWDDNGWIDGADAAAPAALGSFDAMDALIDRLSDRRLFPSLATIVLVGHSAGGQFVQRYAELTHAEAQAAKAGISLRYVIANPSSYAYFTADRPTASGSFAPYPLDRCRRFDQWKYGLEQLPFYASNATASRIERDYVRRDITILLGSRDTDPALGALDKSCAAEAQGPTHFERGHAFFRYLQLRHPSDLRQHLYDIAGMGHNARGMLTSDCALAAIYDLPLCGRNAPISAAMAEVHTGAAAPRPHHPCRHQCCRQPPSQSCRAHHPVA